MTDTLTIQEAMDQASSSLSTSTADDAPVDTTPQEEQSVPEAEVPQDESPKTPLDEFDPEKLPQELKPLYKNLMKGFTQGRQKDREEVNQLRQQLEELKRPVVHDSPERQQDLDPVAAMEKIAEQKVLQAKVNDFRTQAIQDYESLDERLKKPAEDAVESSYDPYLDAFLGAQLDSLLEKHIEKQGNELGFDYKSEGKRLISEWDQYIQKNTEKYLAKQREMAKNKNQVITKSNPRGIKTDIKPNTAMSLEQAMDAAWKKVAG